MNPLILPLSIIASTFLFVGGLVFFRKGIKMRNSNEAIVKMPQEVFDVFCVGVQHVFPNGVITYNRFNGSYQKAKDKGYISVCIKGKTYHIKITPKEK